MRRLFAFSVMVLACSNLEGGNESLTRQQIEDGWILLFDGESTFGWNIQGKARVEDGQLVLGGEKPTKATLTTALGPGALTVESQGGGVAQIHFVSGRGRVSTNLSAREFSADIDVRRGEAIGIEVSSTVNPDGVVIAKAGVEFDADYCSVEITVDPGHQLTIETLRFRPSGLRSIFNGKDLTGWKAVPGRPSVYSVTDAGELNVKNGPGDLHSTDEWDDFVLQLDIVSNGKHLNSGLFFRSRPGQFWSGYESQIRNQWNGDDRTKPVDFGTGGIYGHQPARRVIPTDGRWFTKTVIAHGPHMAVWVDGLQVSDFTDKRSKSDNARKGLKLTPGTISLQGHDPTTDLSFRNIRIADLKRSNGR